MTHQKLQFLYLQGLIKCGNNYCKYKILQEREINKQASLSKNLNIPFSYHGKNLTYYSRRYAFYFWESSVTAGGNGRRR